MFSWLLDAVTLSEFDAVAPKQELTEVAIGCFFFFLPPHPAGVFFFCNMKIKPCHTSHDSPLNGMRGEKNE